MTSNRDCWWCGYGKNCKCWAEVDKRELAGRVYDKMEQVYGANPGGPSLRDEWIDWADEAMTVEQLQAKGLELLGQ